jgi:hypothetical protein
MRNMPLFTHAARGKCRKGQDSGKEEQDIDVERRKERERHVGDILTRLSQQEHCLKGLERETSSCS